MSVPEVAYCKHCSLGSTDQAGFRAAANCKAPQRDWPFLICSLSTCTEQSECAWFTPVDNFEELKAKDDALQAKRARAWAAFNAVMNEEDSV